MGREQEREEPGEVEAVPSNTNVHLTVLAPRLIQTLSGRLARPDWRRCRAQLAWAPKPASNRLAGPRSPEHGQLVGRGAILQLAGERQIERQRERDLSLSIMLIIACA